MLSWGSNIQLGASFNNAEYGQDAGSKPVTCNAA